MQMRRHITAQGVIIQTPEDELRGLIMKAWLDGFAAATWYEGKYPEGSLMQKPAFTFDEWWKANRP
jgi:hypothetical protein